MQKQLLQINNVSFKYSGSVDPVFTNIDAQFSKGWTGVAGTNGSGKTTLLKLLAGIYKPVDGAVTSIGISYYCDQRTDDVPVGFNEFVESYDKRSYRIKDMLMIEDAWLNRWDSLSQGERKRCQIGAALFVNPDILIIDEPTNHIDHDTKRILVKSLQSFSGIGVIVSHDKELLDQLCHHILWLSGTGSSMRKGNYSQFEEEMSREQESIMNMKANLGREIKKLEAEVVKRKRKASQADDKKSKRHIPKKDHDAKSKMDQARLTGKDATEGKVYNRLKSRMERMENEFSSIRVSRGRDLGINIESDKFSKGVLLFYEKEGIDLGNERTLSLPDLYIRRQEKIGLSGVNGSGKSTLINNLVKQLNESGTCFMYVRQEITAEESAEILAEVKDLKNEDKGRIFTIIDKLGSDPKKLLDSAVPSPGEVRKVMLAKGLLDNQQLIIMDEPTNHMDLPSIKCVEDALREFNGSLLLVSHDMVFLNNIVNTQWEIESAGESNNKLSVI